MHRWSGLLLIAMATHALGAEPPPWLLAPTPGQSWQQDRSGIWRGTGTNRGQSWQQDRSGIWRATGTNRGPAGQPPHP